MKLVRFCFFYHNTSINRITNHDTLYEVEKEGLELVANKCIEEIKQSIGLDIKKLTLDYLKHCTFIQLQYNSTNNEILEEKRIDVR